MFVVNCGFSIGLMSCRHSRPLSIGSIEFAKSHYDALDITPKATQADVKNAYYKMSMIYHPDKNKGSDAASKKFRDINAAYEVLGNHRLRKKYDKGILHTAGPQYATTEDESTDKGDETHTRFYQSRTFRTRAPTPTGRTPIYNFDEWSRAHYGHSFYRKQAARDRFERRKAQSILNLHEIQKEIIIFGIIVSLVGLSFIVSTNDNFDIVKESNTENTNNSLAKS